MEVALFNRQRAVTLPLARLERLAARAPAMCQAHPGSARSLLEELLAVEISIVSDRTIARVHREFLNVPGATDVITFPHGEIVVSATTAARQAREHGESVNRELARYIVHGFLHLHGHLDAETEDAARMWRAQEKVLDRLWPAAVQPAQKSSQRPGIAS